MNSPLPLGEVSPWRLWGSTVVLRLRYSIAIPLNVSGSVEFYANGMLQGLDRLLLPW
jgi:hypothetical protein